MRHAQAPRIMQPLLAKQEPEVALLDLVVEVEVALLERDLCEIVLGVVSTEHVEWEGREEGFTG
jgi:hypothetical protein